MTLEPDILKPLDRNGPRRAAVDVYDALLASILSGRLKPGAILSQVEVARSLNVSRTPVREAMRMLQEGGLLIGEPNYRSRVLGFDPADIEALYMKRIVLEALAIAITTRRMTAPCLVELDEVVTALESDEAHGDFELWLTLHRRFHRLLVIEAGGSLVAELSTLALHSERYQSQYKGQHLPGWWQRGEAEHREIFEAVRRREADLASELLAKHLARTALELLAALTPDYDTGTLRSSLRFAITGSAIGRDKK